ncbi:MAG: SpoIID/LytB domain-containing protein [Ruminococcus sp.]|nr:SpoIID/LytB domain-containing protein [Ruminococcus sp.]
MGTDEKKDGKQLPQKGTGKKFKYGIIVLIALLLSGGFVVTMRRVPLDEPPIDNPDYRIVIRTNEFAEVFHPDMEISAVGGMTLRYGEESQEVAAGEIEKFIPDDPRFEDGEDKIRITANDGGEITLHSIQRAYGTPSYAGTIELRRTEEGLVVINELPLEKYLCKVVPSEMPFYYELEALKAQAVCARNFAYKQIMDPGYPEYEAILDDSNARYQVYGNCQEDAFVNQAIEETKNQVMRYKGRLVTTLYFSTSCGYTTGLEAWGTEEDEASRYLKSVEVKGDDGDYEAEIPWYRWEIRIPVETLSSQVSLNTETDIGTIQDIEITKTGDGGIALEVRITGDKDTVTVETENKIRKALGGTGAEVVRQDGSVEPGTAMLPSAFFTIEKEGDAFAVSGGGFGHGIGMSQNGANEMAKKGKNCEEILSLFFYDVKVETEE